MTEIKKTITIEAPPSAVFKALTDEKQLTDWFPTRPGWSQGWEGR